MTSSLFHLAHVYQIKNPVNVLYVWASAHVDARDKGVVVCVMAREKDKIVLIDLVDDRSTIRGTLQGLDCILREVLYLLSTHPCYENSSVHLLMDANPLSKVQEMQLAIQQYCKLTVTWECRVAGMPTQAGVTANTEVRRAAWAAFTGRVTKKGPLYRVCRPMRLFRPGREDQLDPLLRVMDLESTTKPPTNAMYDLALLTSFLSALPPS